MRGLDTRVLLARTRILFLVDAAAANEQMDRVRKQAEADGWIDAANGYHTVPLMFADEPSLVQKWIEGHHRYTHFDAEKWAENCDKWATSANHGCGLSYDLFSERLCNAVDYALERLAPIHHAKAIDIAIHYGYETVDARAEAGRWDSYEGYCSHGIQLGCCPAGCGSGPDD